MQQPLKYFHNRLDSTNLYASQMAGRTDGRAPFWVRTADQFAGRGQGIRTWHSEPGMNLTGSLVIYPERLEAKDQFRLSMIFAVAAATLLELYSDGIRIKWPNDLYAADQKIGGILIENALQGNLVRHSVLGLGINVNQEKFPEDLPNPVSLRILTGMEFNLAELEDLFLESFSNLYDGSLKDGGQAIREQYLQRLFRFGEESGFIASGTPFRAVIRGIDPFGHLLLESGSGMQAFAYQEVEYVIS